MQSFLKTSRRPAALVLFELRGFLFWEPVTMRKSKIGKYAQLIFGNTWQTVAAARWGYSKWMVNQWERGNHVPPVRLYGVLIDEMNAHIIDVVRARDELLKMMKVKDGDPDEFLRAELARERRDKRCETKQEND